MKSWIEELSLLSLESNFKKSGESFKIFPINFCITSTLNELETHISFLKAANSPHKPHIHSEEELIIMLSGKLQIIRSTKNKEYTKSAPLSPGSFTYHDSNRAHTVYSVGPEPAIYVCIKWNGTEVGERSNVLRSSDFIPDYVYEKKNLHSGFETDVIFESPTEYLGKLQSHISHLKPGAGYKPHCDSYDVMIILLDGEIKTLKKELKSKSIVFYHARELHGLKNVGSEIARYIVFEFHGRSCDFRIRKHIGKNFKIILKKLVPRKIRTLFNLCVPEFLQRG